MPDDDFHCVMEEPVSVSVSRSPANLSSMNNSVSSNYTTDFSPVEDSSIGGPSRTPSLLKKLPKNSRLPRDALLAEKIKAGMMITLEDGRVVPMHYREETPGNPDAVRTDEIPEPKQDEEAAGPALSLPSLVPEEGGPSDREEELLEAALSAPNSARGPVPHGNGVNGEEEEKKHEEGEDGGFVDVSLSDGGKSPRPLDSASPLANEVAINQGEEAGSDEQLAAATGAEPIASTGSEAHSSSPSAREAKETKEFNREA